MAILGEPTVGLLLALLVVLLPWPNVLGRFDPAATAAVGIGAFSAAMLLSAPSQAMTLGGWRAETLNPVEKTACWRYGWHGWGWYPCGYVVRPGYGYYGGGWRRGYGYGWRGHGWRRW